MNARPIIKLPDNPDNRALLALVRPDDWRNPDPLPKYNLVVIGAGPAGLAAAKKATGLGAKVALIERDILGGTSLKVGCVPSKAIIRPSRVYGDMIDAESFGARKPDKIPADFTTAMEHMRRVRARIGYYDSAERLKASGIDVFFGDARFSGPRSIEVSGQALHFRKALIATGARPVLPDIPGLAEIGYLTSENLFNLETCPQRLLIIGGGPLGCEAAQAFCRLGSRVIIAQNNPMFLPMEERDAAQILFDAMARDGVEIHLNTSLVALRKEGDQKIADLRNDDHTFSIPFDEILASVGRAPNVESLDLEKADIHCDKTKGIIVDDFLRTTNKCVYAAGDVCMEHKFAHAADAAGHLVVDNALLFRRRRLSSLVIPWCTYTDPEIAHIGLYVWQARAQNIPIKTFTILMQDVDRAITDGEDVGFVKLHLQAGTDKILGATVVARHAGEMITGLSLAITSGIGLRAVARVICAYPTQAEAFKQAANAYNRTRINPLLTSFLTRWFAWSR